MNRLNKIFENKNKKLLNIYFTAGYPNLNDTAKIIEMLEEAGADMIEIGIPFSDPIADGPTIQDSNQKALENGMTLKMLFMQLENIRLKVNIPILLMGYINPVIQYGFEAFSKKCQDIGIDGLILPDMPMVEYENTYQKFYESHNLSSVFLITPETNDQRIRKIDSLTNGFIYMVSSSGTTGKTAGLDARISTYFQRVSKLGLQNPLMVGFGIADKKSFDTASDFADGAIVGSAFIRLLSQENLSQEKVSQFIHQFRND
jgi:tryptophan synthase alpha chain